MLEVSEVFPWSTSVFVVFPDEVGTPDPGPEGSSPVRGVRTVPARDPGGRHRLGGRVGSVSSVYGARVRGAHVVLISGGDRLSGPFRPGR